MSYLKVHKWEVWQTYRKDRGTPPWIKVHRCLMRRARWVYLTDAQRGQLVAMWLLAADRNGFIPDNPGEVKKLCFMRSRPDLEWFIANGWLQRDANVTPTRRQRDAPETEAETETETEAETKAEEEVTPPREYEFVDNVAFAPPTVEQVREFAKANGYKADPDEFFDHYQGVGWMAGRTPIRDWRATFRKWNRTDAKFKASQNRTKQHGSNKPTLDGLGEGDAPPLPFR